MKWLSSFFSGLPISWYIIAILSTILSLSLWFLQGKIEEIGGYKTAQASYVEALKSSQKQLEMRDLSCKIDDRVVSEYQAEKSEHQNKITDNISKIDKLPTKPSTILMSKQDEEIDIDSSLPDSLISVLRASCNPDQGGSCHAP